MKEQIFDIERIVTRRWRCAVDTTITREYIEQKTKEYLAEGGVITKLPAGPAACNATESGGYADFFLLSNFSKINFS